jgi:hypothetical protein
VRPVIGLFEDITMLIPTGATLDEVRPLLKAHHYLGSKTADPMYCFAWRESGGLFGCTGEPHAAIVYASPINKYFGKGSVELTRLVRDNSLDEPLSKFVAWSLRWLKANTELRYCLSYADSHAGHHGGIYQALSFDYVAISKGNVCWVNPATGETVSGRSFDQRRPEYKVGWERSKTGGKYLYVKALSDSRKVLLSRFGWEALPYPKPSSEQRVALCKLSVDNSGKQ